MTLELYGLAFNYMGGNFSCFCCRLLNISKLTFSKNYFRNTIRISSILDLDQDRLSVDADLGPNCLQGYQQMTLIEVIFR